MDKLIALVWTVSILEAFWYNMHIYNTVRTTEGRWEKKKKKNKKKQWYLGAVGPHIFDMEHCMNKETWFQPSAN